MPHCYTINLQIMGNLVRSKFAGGLQRCAKATDYLWKNVNYLNIDGDSKNKRDKVGEEFMRCVLLAEGGESLDFSTAESYRS